MNYFNPLKTVTITLSLFMIGFNTYAQKQIPLKNFFKHPKKSAYQISPDGKYISYLGPYKKRMNIFVQPVGSEKSTRITSVTDRDLGGYFWKSGSRIVYLKDNGGDENFHLYAVNVDGTNLKDLTPFEGVKSRFC
jgi:Tol biopolymer transport system component